VRRGTDSPTGGDEAPRPYPFWRNMKTGVLRKKTLIYAGGMVFVIRKGTKVVVNRGVLTFNPLPLRITRIGRKFYISYSEATRKIEFPEGGKIPYPLSML